MNLRLQIWDRNDIHTHKKFFNSMWSDEYPYHVWTSTDSMNENMQTTYLHTYTYVAQYIE